MSVGITQITAAQLQHATILLALIAVLAMVALLVMDLLAQVIFIFILTLYYFFHPSNSLVFRFR